MGRLDSGVVSREPKADLFQVLPQIREHSTQVSKTNARSPFLSSSCSYPDCLLRHAH